MAERRPRSRPVWHGVARAWLFHDCLPAWRLYYRASGCARLHWANSNLGDGRPDHMAHYVLRRFAGMAVVMFIVASIVFVISHVIPGDPASVMLGPSATAEDVAALRARLGLDAPLPVQYLDFMRSVAVLRLGDSIFLNRSVMQALIERAPLTIQLTLMAAGLATLLGVPIGVLSAVKRGSTIDQVVTAFSMAAASLPSFWIGLTLIEYLAVQWRILPVAGYGPPDADMLERL